MDIGTESAIVADLARNLKRQYEEKMFKIRIQLEKEHKAEMAKLNKEHLAARASLRESHERTVNQMWQSSVKQHLEDQEKIKQIQAEIDNYKAIISKLRNGSTRGEAMPNGLHPDAVERTSDTRQTSEDSLEPSPNASRLATVRLRHARTREGFVECSRPGREPI